MYKKIITKETADFYRKSLPHGYQKMIARKLGCTTVAISQFLAGKNGSERIETAILETIAELREERNTLLKKADLL